MQKKKEQIDLDEFLKKEVSINKHYYIKKMQEHIKQKFMEKLQTEHVCAEWAQMIYFINAQSRRFLQAYQVTSRRRASATRTASPVAGAPLQSAEPRPS